MGDRIDGIWRKIWQYNGTKLIITDKNVFACCKHYAKSLRNQGVFVREKQKSITDNCIITCDDTVGVNRNKAARRSLDEGRDLT